MTPPNKLPLKKMNKYDITEAKKADLDALARQVLFAQVEVEHQQAIVEALMQKAANFSAFCDTWESNKNKALDNMNFAKTVESMALDLENESKIAFKKMMSADKSIQEVSLQVSSVMNKLIYSAEVMNKLAATVIRQKELNPLISDELISLIGKAGEDANNAVALCLVALESCYASLSSSFTAEATSSLEYKKSVRLYELISGKKLSNSDFESNKSIEEAIFHMGNKLPITALLEKAYAESEALFNFATQISEDANAELDHAQNNLNRAQIKLQSLQAGLAAAQAAALAS